MKRIHNKKKTSANEWLAQYQDLKLTKIKLENGEKKVLSCKYCKNEFTFNGKISTRLKEHMIDSQKHQKLKAEHLKREESGKQLTITETQIRLKERQQKCESACHEFVYALALSGQPLGHGKGFVGKFVRKWVFAMRGMPSNGQHLADKYLVEVFNKHINFIKDTIKDEKITIIIDESPDIMGRKTVNALFSFFNAQKREKNIYLVDVSFIKICNTDTITLLVNSIVS
jgi:hypothetical protein